jgi:hypothetical protein
MPLAIRVIEILYGDRNAVQSSAPATRPDLRFGRPRGVARRIVHDGDERVQSGLKAFDTVETRRHQVQRGNLALAYQLTDVSEAVKGVRFGRN